METTSLATDAGLSKLTVPQLKNLCKERNITGYSKLGKNALIQKLQSSGTKIPTCSIVSPRPSNSVIHPKGNHLSRGEQETNGHINPSSTVVASSRDGRALEQITPLPEGPSVENQIPITADSQFDSTALISERPAKKGKHSHTLDPPATPGLSLGVQNAAKNVASSLSMVAHTSVSTPESASAAPSAPLSSNERVLTENKTAMSSTRPTASIERVTPSHAPSRLPAKSQRPGTLTTDAPGSSTVTRVLKGMLPPSRRFRPLKITGPLALFKPISVPVLSPRLSAEPARLFYLDFPSTGPPPTLAPISLPPSKSQRRHVNGFAVILSALSDDDRTSCVLASKMLRYAVYLSAAHLLTANFAGRRLSLLAYMHPTNLTNMWPYLRQRKQEAFDRKALYAKSFLFELFDGSAPVSPRLWTSPDHEKQITVALRFVLTRLWFLLSIGGKSCSSLSSGMVTDVQEIVEGEIWTVTVQHPTKSEVFYVLEATCEVIGRPASPKWVTSAPDKTDDDIVRLRGDWSAYIAQRVLARSAHEAPHPVLLDRLRWTNYEEYERGISKLWLKRIASEGALGRAKLAVAERYVLACVVGNSVSGRWMSSTQMAQEFAGLADRAPSTTPQTQHMNLFLPGVHHVESVHFTTPDGQLLHPALAVVQTPAREYYVLKDDGMQVGCEEDGVSEVWMGVLRCTRRGLVMGIQGT